jgi:hypothetical protein
MQQQKKEKLSTLGSKFKITSPPKHKMNIEVDSALGCYRLKQIT